MGILLAAAILLPAVVCWSFWRAVLAERNEGTAAFNEVTTLVKELEVQGQLEEATAMAREHLTILRKIYRQHKFLAQSYATMGRLQFKRQHYMEAMEMFQEAERMMLSLRMQRTSEFIQLYSDMADFYAARKQYDQAVSYTDKALELLKKYHRNTLAATLLAEKRQEWRKLQPLTPKP